MLRVDVLPAGETEVVLRVVGVLAGQDVGLLAEAVQAQWRPGRQLTLELAQVEYIDPAGLALLGTWASQGLVLRGASLYVRYLLERQGTNQDREDEQLPGA